MRIFLFCRAYLIFISMADIKVADFVRRSCPPPLPSPQSFLFSVSSLTLTLCQNVCSRQNVFKSKSNRVRESSPIDKDICRRTPIKDVGNNDQSWRC